MLKSAIVTTISIVSFCSIVSIADAKDRSSDLGTNFNRSHQPQSDLIASDREHPLTHDDAGVQTEIASIHQAISEHYRNWNERLAPSSNAWSGACSFLEVKSLKLLSLSSTNAELEAEVQSQSYSLLGVHIKPRQWAFKKYQEKYDTRVNTTKISLEKINGKWKVRS